MANQNSDPRVTPVRIDKPISLDEARRIFYRNTTPAQRVARADKVFAAVAAEPERNAPLTSLMRGAILNTA